MKKFVMAAVLAFAYIAVLAGCTQQNMAKHWGGTVNQDLPPGQKFVTISWEEDNMWVATRPMLPGEKPETITVQESSSFGMMQGTIILHERAAQ